MMTLLPMVAEVIDNTTSRGRTLRFLYDGPHDEFKKALYALGETPLPHTILNRPVEEEDAERFQSIFAKNEGVATGNFALLTEVQKQFFLYIKNEVVYMSLITE